MKSKSIDYWKKAINKPTKEFKDYFSYETRYLKDNLKLDQVVVDIGCGDGRSIIPVLGCAKKIILVDNDPKAVTSAVKNFKDEEKISVLEADAESMPLEDNSVDVVFVGLTFSNFGKTKFAILKEIKRVLRDDGKLIFSVFNESSLELRKKCM